MSEETKDTEMLTRPKSQTSGGGLSPEGQHKTNSSSSCFPDIEAQRWFSIALILLVISIVLLAVLIFEATSKKNPVDEAGGVVPPPELSYSYCDTPPECVNDVNEFAAEVNHTNGFWGPACVVNNMMGRVVVIASNNSNISITKLRPTGRIAFSIGPEMLARILVIGRYRATNIVQELGYGTGYTCGTPGMNYTDCQYRLIVWTVPCPPSEPPLIQGFWDNLQEFYETRVYGNQTPDLSAAVATIHASYGQLQNFTGCDPFTLNLNGQYYNVTQQRLANCSQEFIDAMANFSTYPVCNGTDKNNPHYSLAGGCIPEDRFLSIPQPTAVQLRAFLMQTEGFNPLYTGYGFTSSTSYYDPQQQEYWYENEFISTLDNATIITFYNGTALGLGV